MFVSRVFMAKSVIQTEEKNMLILFIKEQIFAGWEKRDFHSKATGMCRKVLRLRVGFRKYRHVPGLCH